GRSAIAVRQGDGAGGAAQGFQPGGDDQAHARGQRLSQPPDAELMAEVTMPRLSDTMEEGTIAAWLKKPGEQVSKGDVVARIGTEKATMALTAFEAGTLQEILAPEGTTVAIGQPVARIGSGAAVAPPPPAPEPPTRQEPASAPESPRAEPPSREEPAESAANG